MKSKQATGVNKPEWLDMSNYVVHFTKDKGKKTAYDNCLSILASQTIKARNKFGLGRKSEHATECVCFSEIPLGYLQRLAKERGEFGIGFRKDFVLQKDGGPIMYAYKDTSHATALRVMLECAKEKSDDPFWYLAPFIDMPGDYPTGSYYFEWEREWRHLGNFNFQQSDAAFLIMPDKLHGAARGFFDDAEQENTGPNYKCPFIDPYWGIKKVKKVLAKS